MKENYMLRIAVVPWVLDDTLNFKTNTNGKWHGVMGYNPYYFRWREDKGKYIYDKNNIEIGNIPKIEKNEVINKVGVYQW